MKKLSLATYYKLLKQEKENLLLIELNDKIVVTNKRSGNTYQVSKPFYDSHRSDYDIVKPKSNKSKKERQKVSIANGFKVPDDPYDSKDPVPDRQSGVQAVKNVMIQYGGGGGQEGWDEVWEKHKKQVETLLDKMLKKTKLTYHDLGNLVLPEGQYTTLASGQAAPPEFEKLQSLMADIADQAQDNFMFQEEFKKWASNWDWKTGKPKTEKTESKQPKKSVFQSIIEKRKRINNKYFKLEQTIWSDKSLTQEQREKKISQFRRLKNKELEQL